MKNKNLYISNIGKGSKAILVAVTDNDPIVDSDSRLVEVSIQSRKPSINTKVCLICKHNSFKKFLNKLEKEIKNQDTPELYTVAQLYCESQCEILRVIKVDNDSYDVLMYYNYRRPFTRKNLDYVNLTQSELKSFIKGVK